MKFFYSTSILNEWLPRSVAWLTDQGTEHIKKTSKMVLLKKIWKVAVGEILTCEWEPRNAADWYAVAVKKDGATIRHLPRKVSGPSLDCRYRKRAIWRHSKQPGALCSMQVWKCADHYYCFVDVIIHCKIYFVFFIFVFCTNHENIFATKVSGSTVGVIV